MPRHTEARFFGACVQLAEWDEDDKAGEPLGFGNLSREWTRRSICGFISGHQSLLDARARQAAWEAEGRPISTEHTARVRRILLQDIGREGPKQREQLAAARRADSWIAAAIASSRCQEKLFLDYAPLIIPKLTD